MKLEIKNKLGHVYYRGEYNPTENWLDQSWMGYVSAQEVIEAVKKMMETFDHLKYGALLNDNTEIEGSWEEANEWIAQNWMPKAQANGLKKFAFIVSPDIFAAISAEDLVSRMDGFETRTFQSKKEAETWLRAN